MTDKEELGASLFAKTIDIMENDPLEEIFALNMGDFVSEYLISEDLANKIGKSAKNKTEKLKSQLKELISIYRSPHSDIDFLIPCFIIIYKCQNLCL